MCHMANCLCEKGSWQALTDVHTAASYAIVPELTYKTNILRKRSPCCKLVSLSACNFLHCLFCCALKIWYLVLPCECLIVDSLLSHSCFSISLSLTVQCKCLSSRPGNKASWQLSRSGSACHCSSCHSGSVGIYSHISVFSIFHCPVLKLLFDHEYVIVCVCMHF